MKINIKENSLFNPFLMKKKSLSLKDKEEPQE